MLVKRVTIYVETDMSLWSSKNRWIFRSMRGLAWRFLFCNSKDNSPVGRLLKTLSMPI
jgi:hypothetical protein